jgi:putative flippase GtrA
MQTTAIVFLFDFSCHRLWTFRDPQSDRAAL